jgi:hypothetical protein
MGEVRNSYSNLVGNPKVKRPLRSTRRRWNGNIRMDLRKIGWDCVDWIHLAQCRDQWRVLCEKGNEPSGSIKGRE